MSNKPVSEESARFDGSIPEMYDQHLGELLFEPYAADIADRVAKRRPRKVLEIAAGTGIASRRLLKALPRGTALTVTDLNTPMLEKGGALIFNVWDSLERNPVGMITHSTIGKFFQTDPPDFYRIPFGLGDVSEVRRLVEEAGFKEIVIETLSLTGSSNSPESAALGLVRGNPVINTIRERGTADIDEIVRAVARAMEERFGAGPIRVPLRAHVVSAIKS